MGLPERIPPPNPPARAEECSVTRLLRTAPKAARRHLRNGVSGGEMTQWRDPGLPNELTDSFDVDRLVGVILEVKSKMCPECPQPNCPTEGVLEIIRELPLRRGAQAIMDIYSRNR